MLHVLSFTAAIHVSSHSGFIWRDCTGREPRHQKHYDEAPASGPYQSVSNAATSSRDDSGSLSVKSLHPLVPVPPFSPRKEDILRGPAVPSALSARWLNFSCTSSVLLLPFRTCRSMTQKTRGPRAQGRADWRSVPKA